MVALRSRDVTGEGQEIDAAICDSLLRWSGSLPATLAMTKEAHVGQGADLWTAGRPTTGFLRSSDGRWLFVRQHHSDAAVARLYKAMGRPELASDPKYGTEAGRKAHSAEIRRTLEAWAAT